MIIPQKLKIGDEIRVIAPSRSLNLIDASVRAYATKVLENMGLKVTFSENCELHDDFNSSSIEQRINDLHNAFLDKNVKAIITVIGGYNSNQLLKYLDYDLIKNNPKIFCGYSDITALSNAIYTKTKLITYYGPHYSSFGMRKGIDYTIDYFNKSMFSSDEYTVKPSLKWSDDLWFLNQKDRKFYINDGFKILSKGNATGKLIGGNLCTLNLLQGTEYMPDLSESILFIEDTELSSPEEFDRNLQSLIHLPSFNKVKGMVVGRFQLKSKMKEELFKQIILSKIELKDIPVIYNADFGHTTPIFTFPIGGIVEINTLDEISIKIKSH